jgi:hypothetical protein
VSLRTGIDARVKGIWIPWVAYTLWYYLRAFHENLVQNLTTEVGLSVDSMAALSNAAPAGALAPAIYFSGALRKHIIWADY